MSASSSPSARDPRVDFLRGVALLSIFVDHIPKNRLADFTLHNFGLCDAAELFVILAGFSASSAYTRVFERDGLRVGLVRVFARCLQIYGVHVALLLCTLAFVSMWQQVYGMESLILGPMLRDGWKGAVRGIELKALPAYLDILPLYIALLSAFPLVRFGMARSPSATVAASFLIYAGANLFQWNLPNVVDRADAAHWYFDPFTWQFIFVLGCWLSSASRRRLPIIVSPPKWLIAACWIYTVAAFIAVDAWKLWPTPFGLELNGLAPSITVLGNEPKTYVSPWRLLNVLAWTYLLLTSPAMIAVSRWRIFGPVVACGRHSLQVFAAGCVLALFGRLTFRSYEVTALSQTFVNTIGISGMMALGIWLDRMRAGRIKTVETEVGIDAETSCRISRSGDARVACAVPSRSVRRFCAGLGLAGASTTPTPPPAPIVVTHTDLTRDNPELRIVAFGSSSTQGVGASSVAANYPSRLETLFADAYKNRLLVRVVNRGIGGEDIDDMMRRLKTDVLARKPDLVIWQVGSNDALRGVSVDDFKAELRDGIGAIRATGAEVVLMDPQWSPQIDKVDASSRFVDAVGDIGRQEHVDVIHRFQLMHRWMENGIASQGELIGPDGLHMTDKGYDLLAQAVFKELSSHSARLQDRVAIAAKRP